MDPAHRVMKHVHTHLKKDSLFTRAGITGNSKPSLSRTSAYRHKALVILCIHMAWGNHITGLQKLVLTERPRNLLRSTKHIHT